LLLIDDLLQMACNLGVSDIHLSVNNVPVVRLNGELIFLDQLPEDEVNPAWRQRLSLEDTKNLAEQVLKGHLLEKFQHDGEIDLSYSIAGLGRFRINVFRQRGSTSLAIRPVKMVIPSLAGLGLPETAARLARLPRGLVLVTGPTGSGKSTTLAAMIDLLNT
jgi:twitching motility protein PilT